MFSCSLFRAVTTSVIALALTAGAYAQTTGQYPRLKLIEEFTSTTCGPCAAASPLVNTFANIKQGVISVRYHCPIPVAGDPWYAMPATQADVDARMQYYSVNSAPWAQVGAKQFSPHPGVDGTGKDGNARMTEALGLTANTSFMSIAVTQEGSKIKVTVKSDNAVTGATLHVVALTRHLSWPTVPGTNGEKEFEDVMLKMYPDANGTAITLGAGETKTFEFSPAFGSGPAWGGNQYFAAFVQSNSTKEILQAGAMNDGATPKPDYAYASVTKVAGSTTGQYLTIDKGATKAIEVSLKNNGSAPSTVGLTMQDSANLSQIGWSWTVSPASVTIAAGATEKVTVNITAPTRAWYSEFSLGMTASDGIGTGVPSFGLLTNGARVAVYNSFSGGFSGLATAISNINVATYGTDAVYIPFNTAANIAYPYGNFEVTVYPIDYEGRGALRGALLDQINGALNTGKKVWITAHIEGALNATGSQSADPATQEFYATTLGMTPVTAVQFITQQNQLIQNIKADSVTNDPISGSASVILNQPTQNWPYYQLYMDVFTAANGASALPVYTLTVNMNGTPTKTVVAFRYQRSNGAKLYYSAFGLEAVNGSTNQFAYTKKVLDWLTGTVAQAPAVTFTRQSVAFGSVAANSSKEETVSIRNTGNANLVINAVAVAGADPQWFDVFEGVPGQTPITVAPGSSHAIKIRFTPTQPNTNYSATLTVQSNATGAPALPLTGNSNVTSVETDVVSLTGAVGLRLVGSNPVTEGSAVELRANGTATVTIVDNAGRTVATLFSGSVQGTERVALNAANLPAGTYNVVAGNGSENAILNVVVVR